MLFELPYYRLLDWVLPKHYDCLLVIREISILYGNEKTG